MTPAPEAQRRLDAPGTLMNGSPQALVARPHRTALGPVARRRRDGVFPGLVGPRPLSIGTSRA
eukprot:520099-Alexandrium_andersonii.AAC.1